MMGRYFTAQLESKPSHVTYLIRQYNKMVAAKSELLKKTIAVADLDILASELRFVEMVEDLPIFERV